MRDLWSMLRDHLLPVNPFKVQRPVKAYALAKRRRKIAEASRRRNR